MPAERPRPADRAPSTGEAPPRPTQRALLQSYQLLQRAEELSNVGSFAVCPPEGRAAFSAEALRIFALDPGLEHVSRELIEARVHPDDVARVTAALDEVEAHGGLFDLEFRIVRPDGGAREVHVRAQATTDPDGRARELLGAVEDVTERRQAERSLRESEDRYRQLFETTHDLVQSVGPDGRILFVNRAWSEALGYAEADVPGLCILDVIHPRSREHCRAVLARVMGGETLDDVEVWVCTRDGRERLLVGHAAPRRLAGEVIATQGVFRDVTERRRAEAELEASRETAALQQRLAEIGTLTIRIVHDLANPIAGLVMSAQTLLRRLEQHPEARLDSARSAVERLLGTACRLDTILGEFKSFAAGQRLLLAQHDLGALLRDVVVMWTSEAQRRGIELELAAVETVQVHADRDKLQRVLDNLVKNAFEAIGEGPGRVRLDVSLATDGEVCISVTDTGPGLPPDRDVFALFETTKDAGTGLGLPICREIVLAHGGRIDLEPAVPRGVVARIHLPRV